MYIKKYWGNFIGGSDDSLNLVAFLEDQKKEEIPLSEIFAKIGLDKQSWDFRQTVEYLEFTHSDGVEMDFHFAIDVVTDLAAILLECSVSGSVNLQDLDEYNTPVCRIRITATPEEHDAMNKSLADFAQNPLEYDISEMMGEDEITDMAYQVEMLRKELYEASGRNRNYHVKAEDVKHLLPDWEGADGCIATNRITVEGYKVAQAIMEYLDCECTYFPSMADDDPIMSAYSYAQRLGVREGFVPVLIKADDETLLECLVMNADPENDADFYEFDLKTVMEYRKKMLSAPVKDGKAVLEELTGQRKEEAEDDDMDWEEEVLGEMEGGYDNDRFSCYWDSDSHMTYPLILAKIPVKNPWEIFAYLPFGNWNECPDTPELMAVAKYWFEQHGAVPAAMTHDELEFLLPVPVSKEKAMELAAEQYGFCPDIVDQEQDDPTVGNLADVLWQSTVWYFWWD